MSVVYFCMTVLSHILPIFSSEKNLYRMSVRGMLVNERAARPLEEEVGRNPVACDTGRGSLCSASRRRRDRGAGCWSGMPRRDRRRAAASDRRRRRWLAGTCHTFARPARPRACLARPRALVACLHSWSPDLEDLQAARHARGSSQPDRDTTPARARSVAAHAPWALAGRANWTSTVVGCLRPAGRQAKPSQAKLGRSIQSLSPVLFFLLVVIPTRKKNNTSSRRVTRRYQYATKTTPAGNVRTLSEPRTRSRLPLLPRKQPKQGRCMQVQCNCTLTGNGGVEELRPMDGIGRPGSDGRSGVQGLPVPAAGQGVR